MGCSLPPDPRDGIVTATIDDVERAWRAAQDVLAPRWSLDWYRRDAQRVAEAFARVLDVDRSVDVDPEATAAFEQLSPIGDSSRETPPADRQEARPCPNRRAMAMAVDGHPEVWLFRCDNRRCVACGHRWITDKVAQLNACPMPPYVYVAEIPKAQWDTLTRRLRDRGAGWMGAPTPDGHRLIVTDDETVAGVRMRRADAVACFEGNLAAITEADAKGNVRTGGAWKQPPVSTQVVKGETGDSPGHSVVALGYLTKCTSLASLIAAVETYGGKVQYVADDDIADVDRWKLTKLSEIGLRAVWERLGLVSIAELQERRASARARAGFDDLLTRRPWRNDVAA
jgi:hypothetical protein